MRPQDREGELSDSSNDEGPLVDYNQMQRDYYLAYKQLRAYAWWIKHPAQAAGSTVWRLQGECLDYVRIIVSSAMN